MSIAWPQYGSDPIDSFAGNPCTIQFTFVTSSGDPLDVSNWTNWTSTAVSVFDKTKTVNLTPDASQANVGLVFLSLSGDQTLTMNQTSGGWSMVVKATLPEGNTTLYKGLIRVDR